MTQERPVSSRDCFSALLAEAREGSAEAVGLLLDSYRKYLLFLANQKLPGDLRSKAGGSDLVQETIHATFLEFQQFRGDSEEEFVAWLRTILDGSVRGFIRSYRASQKRNVRRERSLDTAEGHRAYSLPCAPGPSSALESQEDALAVRWATLALPEDYQRVLQLRYHDSLTFAQIGSQLGVSEDAAQKLCTRALHRVSKHLNELGIFS